MAWLSLAWLRLDTGLAGGINLVAGAELTGCRGWCARLNYLADQSVQFRRSTMPVNHSIKARAMRVNVELVFKMSSASVAGWAASLHR